MISLHATDKLPLANYFYLEINVFVATDICIPQHFVSIYWDFKHIDNEYNFHPNILIYLQNYIVMKRHTYIYQIVVLWYAMFSNYLISWFFSVWIGLNHNWIAFMSCHYDCSVSKKVCVILSDFPYMYIHCRLSLIWCAWVCEYISFHWNVIGKHRLSKATYLFHSFLIRIWKSFIID